MIAFLLLTSCLVIITICLLFGNLSSFKKFLIFKVFKHYQQKKKNRKMNLDFYNRLKDKKNKINMKCHLLGIQIIH